MNCASYLARNWRPLAFIVYAIICLFDFVIMPGVIEMANKAIDPSNIATLALRFKDAATQLEMIKILGTTRVWEPLTMVGSGLFHLAFGALLTSASYTRGLEKIETIRKQNKNIIDENK